MASSGATSVLAAVVIAAELAILAWLILSRCRASRFSPRHYPVYLFGVAMTRVRWRAKIIGRFELQRGSGAVVVGNHRGPIDPAFVGLAVNGPVHWMVAREYFDFPLFGTMLRHLQAVPTSRRGIDTAATRQILRYVQSGSLVGVFPEGRINTTSEPLLPAHPGAAVIALKARVPIIPIHVAGSPNDPKSSYGFLHLPARTTLHVGSPIDISEFYDRAEDRDAQQMVMRRVMKAVARLGGYPDFEPQLIGRRRSREVYVAAV